jgi:hypothetical protein
MFCIRGIISCHCFGVSGGSSTVCKLAYSHPAVAVLRFAQRMGERKDKRPEIDIPTPPHALIGLVPAQSLPEPAAERPLDIPTIIRAFQTDAYPLPDGAPLRIAVSDEASLTLYPQHEAIEYCQQTPEHVIYLKASKRGEVAFSVTPKPPPVKEG